MKRAISLLTTLALVATAGTYMLPAEELTSGDSAPEQAYVYEALTIEDGIILKDASSVFSSTCFLITTHQPVDMFPFCDALETVALITKDT